MQKNWKCEKIYTVYNFSSIFIMKKVIILTCMYLVFAGFEVQAVSYNNNIVNCSGSLSDTNGRKQIPTSNNYNTPSAGTISCNESGYYGGSWSSWRSRWSHYACPSWGYASQYATSGSSYRVYCKLRDNEVPTLADVTNNNPIHLLANNNYPYSFSVSDGWWAPITIVEGYRESYDDEAWVFSFSLSGTNITQPWNMSRVDNYRDANWARDYSFTITRICDEAWNCWTGSQTYTHYVYANTGDINPATTGISDSDQLTSGNIADGTVQSLEATLRDTYWNNIVPATGISRVIDFNLNGNNSLYMNQYDTSWGSAIFIAPDTNYVQVENGITETTIANMSPWITDIYQINFQVYSPTANSLGDITQWNGSYILNSAWVDIADDISGPLTSLALSESNFEFNFRPLYYSQFDDSSDIKQFGLRVDGWVQNSVFDLIENSSSVTTSVESLYMTYGWVDITNLDMFFWETGIPDIQASESWLIQSSTLPWWITNDRDLVTLLQSSGTISASNNTYLWTHIAYTINTPLWSREVVYQWEVIWSYDGLWDLNTFNSWLRVVGSVQSQNQTNIIDEQWSSLESFWWISKSNLRSEIKKNVYTLIKDTQISSQAIVDTNIVSLENWIDDVWDDTDVWDGLIFEEQNILYFEAGNNENVVIRWDNIAWNDNMYAQGNKTLIIEGRNLYIKDNIYYASSSDILWIIVLQDEDGNGWNIYIDPAVTNIAATIYAEGSLISFDGSNELSGNTQQEMLKNQLHIYGSVFSENTIGGSVNWTWPSLYTCPFNMSENICDKDTAQKYDLNYLRRYQLYAVDQDWDNTTIDDIFTIPVHSWKVSGNGVCSYDFATLHYRCNTFADFSPHTISNIYATQSGIANHIYLEYPVIIQYNPSVQLTPPPLFEQQDN